jgi:hypothetical protein
MYEIYKSELVDLLNTGDTAEKPQLFVKTDASGSVYVENGTVTPELKSPEELDRALEGKGCCLHPPPVGQPTACDPDAVLLARPLLSCYFFPPPL